MRDVYGPLLRGGIIDPVTAGATTNAWGASISYFTINGANPGIRECFVAAWKVAIPYPAIIYGVSNMLSGTFSSAGQNPRMRLALFSSQGNMWKSGGIYNGLPGTPLASCSSGWSLSAMQANVVSGGRRFYQAFDTPTAVLTPNSYWVVGICECIYSASGEVNPTAVIGGGSDSVLLYSNELMSSATCRNIALTTVQTGGIDTLNFNTYANLTASSWTVQLGGSSGFTLTGRALAVPSGASFGNTHWNLHAEPYV